MIISVGIFFWKRKVVFFNTLYFVIFQVHHFWAYIEQTQVSQWPSVISDAMQILESIAPLK